MTATFFASQKEFRKWPERIHKSETELLVKKHLIFAL